jgi:transposase
MTRLNLTDEEFALLEPFLPPQRAKRRGRSWLPHRPVLDGIFWLLRTGAPWRDLPECYGPWERVYQRFHRWVKEGLWQRIVDTLQGKARREEAIDWEVGAIDSSVIPAHKAAAGAPRGEGEERLSPEESREKQALGKSQGGLSTKLHILVEGQGKPMVVELLPGQCHEAPHTLALINTVQVKGKVGRPRQRFGALAADKAYDGEPLRAELRRLHIRPVIAHRHLPDGSYPARARFFDKEVYRRRNVVERMIGRLKEFRRIATRYEKLVRNFMGMILLGFIRIWMKDHLLNRP